MPEPQTPSAPPRKRRILRWILRLTLAVALVAGLSAHGIWVRAHRSLPIIRGEIAVAGLEAPVDILRDRQGVPHIFAQSQADALFAQGFVHAQDRLWQMMFSRAFGHGRLSEMTGPLGLSADMFVRALDLAGASRRALGHIAAEERKLLDAYAAGVNAFLRTNRRPLPLEFALADYVPEPWHAEDSILLVKLLALQLAGNAFTEVRNVQVLRALGPEGFAALTPGLERPLPSYSGLYGLPETPAATSARVTGPGGASNNWVVDGTRTASGKPLLANDPHLGLTIPSTWYLAHLAMEGRNIIGASLAGVPGIVLGRNDRVAWGFTNTGADVQDLYLERLDPTDSERYVGADRIERFTVREETLRVRFAPDKIVRFRSTRHGPVLPDEFFEGADFPPPGHVLAIAFPTLADDDRTIVAGHKLMFAESCAAFREALRDFVAPMQNMVCGDIEGHIGLDVPARVPIRKAENLTRGLVPAPGWIAAYEWQGYISYEALPHGRDADTGYFVTANNAIVSPAYPHFLGYGWDTPDRAWRIEDMIRDTRAHTAESFAAMQMDDLSHLARDTLPGMIEKLATKPPRHPRAAEALELLSSWNGRMAADLPQPLIFAAWCREVLRLALIDDLGALLPAYWGPTNDILRPLLEGEAPLARFCDVKDTPGKEECEDILSRAFDHALTDLVRYHGRWLKDWRWGTAHRAIFRHLLLGPLAGRSVESGGSWDTVFRGQMRFSARHPFANIHAAGYRAVYDLGNPAASLFIISTGQSGNLLSPHYDDLTADWAAGRFLPMTTDRARLEADGAALLRLVPALR